MVTTKSIGPDCLLKLLQTRTAQLAIGPSTLRNQGAPKVVANTREFLKELDLAHFKMDSPKAFMIALNEETERLQSALPRGARHWGTARKALNIFLRDVLYNRYLCNEYGFRNVEPWLELPLDSKAAKGLLAEFEGSSLARWRNIKDLTAVMSDDYQNIAKQVAERRGIARIHLDLIYWMA